MLTVWGRRTSSNVQAVMWCIGELGLPYERHDIGHKYGGTDTAAFGALNPNRTIPVLRDGGDAPLWESAAIMRYLAGRYGSAPFWPPDGPARAQIDKWAEWAKLNVSLAFTGPIFWQVVRTPAARRDAAVIARGLAAFGRLMDSAEAQIARGGFLAGADFTLADVQFGHVLYRYFTIAIERPERAVLRRYYESLVARPAFAEHVMVSFEELKAE
jgi:glutathione S-transferase